MRRALFGFLAVIPFAACTCEEPLGVVAPKILIGDPIDPSHSACATEQIKDCAFDFGDVAIGSGSYFRFTINNPTGVDLTIRGIGFTEGSDASFTIEGQTPKAVFAGSDVGPVVVVKFVPTVASVVTATLVIESDGANVVDGERVEIALTGNGLDLGQPEIVVTPERCDFGDVGVGVTAFCDVTFQNNGRRDLEISGVSFTSPTDQDVFGASGVFVIPTFVAPGTGTSITLFARPTASQEYGGGLIVESNDPQRPSIEVPLTVRGAQAPTAIPEIKSVNGQQYAAGDPIEPLADVVITGVNSVAANAAGSIATYFWEITSKPAESTVQLSDPNSMETGFYFASAGGNYQGLDVVGTFEVRLTVTDDDGMVSTNDARLQLNAVPTEGLHVQLTWDVGQNDIDMHLLRNGGEYCSQDDCYYANCKATSSNRPNWDGASTSYGDPSLDVDDLSGFGPENINIDIPVDGTYRIGIHFFSGSTDTFVTAKIFLNGALREEYTREFTEDDDFWAVADVQFANGAAVVIPVDTFETDWSCY